MYAEKGQSFSKEIISPLVTFLLSVIALAVDLPTLINFEWGKYFIYFLAGITGIWLVYRILNNIYKKLLDRNKVLSKSATKIGLKAKYLLMGFNNQNRQYTINGDWIRSYKAARKANHLGLDVVGVKFFDENSFEIEVNRGTEIELANGNTYKITYTGKHDSIKLGEANGKSFEKSTFIRLSYIPSLNITRDEIRDKRYIQVYAVEDNTPPDEINNFLAEIISSSRKGLNMVNLVPTKETNVHVQAY